MIYAISIDSDQTALVYTGQSCMEISQSFSGQWMHGLISVYACRINLRSFSMRRGLYIPDFLNTEKIFIQLRMQNLIML